MPKGRTYTGGSIVYFQNDTGNDIYVLQKGRVILLSTAIDTGEEIKEEVQKGEFFGVKSALGGYPREETAQTLGPTQIIVFSLAEFEAYVLKNTRLIMTMARVFSRQLRDIHRQVRELLHAGAVSNPSFELLGVAESFHQTGQMEHAVYAYQRYLELNPNGSNVSRAQELLQMARKGLTYPIGYPPPEPEEDWETDVEIDISRGMADANTALDDPGAAKGIGSPGKKKTKPILEVFKEAMSAFEAADYEKALKGFEACTKFSHLRNDEESKAFAQAHYQLGQCQIKLGRFEEAQTTLSNYLKQFPTEGFVKESIFHMGVAAEALGNPERARTLYSKAATMPPPNSTSREAQKRLEALN